MKSARHLSRQRGSILLEALFGILIFSTGILALIGLQAASIKQVASGKYRSDASLLASRLIGQMWIADRTAATLLADFSSPTGADFVTWRAGVQASLPGAATYPPTVVITDIAGSTVQSTHRQAVVTVYWKPPNESAAAAAHSYLLVAHIK